MSNTRLIRRIVLEIERTTKDIELMRKMVEIVELTHTIENDLGSVGAKAEKEQGK